MADVLVEYITRVKRVIEVPDDMYEAAIDWYKTIYTDPQKYREADNYFNCTLWERVMDSDTGFEEACGIYSPDEKIAIAEY